MLILSYIKISFDRAFKVKFLNYNIVLLINNIVFFPPMRLKASVSVPAVWM